MKSVCWVTNENSSDSNELCFVSASHDQSVFVWHLDKEKNQVVRTEKCVGHTESVECVDVNAENNKVFFSFSF